MGKDINKYIATIERFGSRFAKQIIETIIPPVIMLFALFTLFGLVFYIILRATKPDYQLFELATLSALLGGFVLASGFIGQNNNNLRLNLRRIGALYLVSAIAFILFGLYIPVDAMPDKSEGLIRILKILMPTSFYVGALTFTGATSWLLLLLPTFFRRNSSKDQKRKSN